MGCKEIELGWKMYSMVMYGITLTIIIIAILVYLGFFPNIDISERKMMLIMMVVGLSPTFPLLYLMELSPVKFCDDRIILPTPRTPIFKAQVSRHGEIKYDDIETVYQITFGQRVVSFGIVMKNGESEKLRLGPFCSEDARKQVQEEFSRRKIIIENIPLEEWTEKCNKI